MERPKFEEGWKQAFSEAELTPSDNVWTNVELDLEKTNGGQLKRKLLFFQLLAAASIFFALGVGVGVFIMDKDASSTQQSHIALSTESEDKSIKEQNTEGAITSDQSQSTSGKKNSKRITKKNSSSSGRTTERKSSIHPDRLNSTKSSTQSEHKEVLRTYEVLDQSKDITTDFAQHADGINDDDLYAFRSHSLPAIVEQKEIALTFPAAASVADPVALMLARLNLREQEILAKEEKTSRQTSKSENLWTSIGFSAGSFEAGNASVNQTASNAAIARNSKIADKEANAPGISYSIGMNIGTKLSERWVVQGGVNYMTNSSEYNVESAVLSPDYNSFKPASVNELDKLNSPSGRESKIIATAPYNVNNSLRYLSVPLQAGYLIINRDFGLQLNAGVATDLFLQNTVKGEGVNLDATTQDSGDESPYRPVNFSGLVGTELSYRFAQRYRIALNPGIRYPFNTIYKSDLGIQTTPITFDIGLRFRYIFK